MTEAEFMADPDLWPNWPWLPVVGRKGTEHQGRDGVVLSHSLEGRLPTPVKVYPTNLFAMDRTVTPIEYPDIAAVLQHWRID